MRHLRCSTRWQGPARAWGLLAAALAMDAGADLTDLTFQSELESLAARSNQATYDQLKQSTGCDDIQDAATRTCAGGTFIVWKNVRELVHTANDLTGSGPTKFSLNQRADQLGFTLRWTAAEEFASQGAMSSNFINGQLSGLAARITAIRTGSTGFRLGQAGTGSYEQVAGQPAGRAALGGGASADQGDGWSPWGGFINFSYVAGSRDPSDLEDAFDFDGSDINGGMDYRFANGWVVGLVLGYQEQLVDFDSSLSIVDGEAKSVGYSMMPFVLLQRELWYWSFSLGYQAMAFETQRRISYPSFNPDIASVNTAADSETSARVVSAYSSAGWTFSPAAALSIEPYLALDYYHIDIDRYAEADLNDEGFDFIVLDQQIDYLEGILAVKLQYVLTPPFAVIVPFLDAQWHHQFETDPREITAVYQAAAGDLALNPNAYFRLPTDALDPNYAVYAVGLSALVRGARQRELGQAAAGGLQTYLLYRHVSNLDYYRQAGVSLGLRYEF